MSETNSNDINEIISSLRGYVDRMKQIRSLSSPDLQGITNAEAYSSVLRENFNNIGQLAQENKDLISEVLDPILNSKEALDPELLSAIERLNEELLDASDDENIDLTLSSMLTDRLLKDTDATEDLDYRIGLLDKEIENSNLLINMTKRVISKPGIVSGHRKKGISALEELLKYLDRDKFLSLSHESRETIMINARYGTTLYESIKPTDDELTKEQFDMLEYALKISSDPFYQEAMPDFDWIYHTFRIHEYLTRLDYSHADSDTLQKAVEYADKCIEIWKSDPEYYGDLSEFEELEGRRLRIYNLAGRIDDHEFTDAIYKMFKNRKQFDYTSLGYDLNIEYPRNYMSLLKMDEATELDIIRSSEMYREALEYIFHMPKLGQLSVTLDPYAKMLIDFKEFPGNITFEEMGLQSFAALHPPTYIHSLMVADITRCLTRHLIYLEPELFHDVFSYLGVEDLPENRYDVIDYAYHAALCHDFGKLMIVDTIFVYGRKLMDMEFDLVKQHPDIGWALLSSHSSTRRYADIARGHHLWYDGTKGYPSDFDISGNPLKVIIDIVAIADCMDAATDNVGRSYNSGKNLSDYEQEVARDAGTRYAPWGPKLLSDPGTKADLEYILNEGRMSLYKETYKLLSSNDTEPDEDELD